uniref:NADH-ubiquinone oxidoreductase chain 2 n=1 Tax=Analcellicampa danfengensis TaxID=2419779 RepID=A0A7U0IUG6_9HYME|nr:NADH dehydrogenase subunit 2 [Analcellicampa danfengensis]QQV69247.1 NADH dehydrogenase subunit 2 [Analcellicampa danfengensis]
MTKKLKFNKNLLINKFNNFKLMFFMTLIMGTMISINSNTWINAWMGMEINLLSFIPLMFNLKKSSNSTMLYFITQALASSLILFSTLMMKIEFNLMKMNMMFSMIQFSLLIKLGAAPMHWWTPKIFLNLNWKMSFIFLTWQKIAPLILLNSSSNNNSLFYMTAISSTILGALLGMNQSLIKLIMIYSSINHTGWMLMIMMLNVYMMIFYFLIYSIMNFMICIMMNNSNINYINQLFKINNQNLFFKMITISMFLSLGGMPPLLGFLPKMLVLITMMNNNLFIESFMFIIMATVTLSFYMNPLMSMFLSIKISTKWNFKIKHINKFMIILMLINLSISLTILPFLTKFL